MQAAIEVYMSCWVYERTRGAGDARVVPFAGEVEGYLRHVGGVVDLGVWGVG